MLDLDSYASINWIRFRGFCKTVSAQTWALRQDDGKSITVIFNF